MTHLANFIDNPQGITGDIEYCSMMLVAFTLLQVNINRTSVNKYFSNSHQRVLICTRSSAIAEGPRDAQCQLKP